MSQQIKVRRALVSVWDKSGLEPFVQGLKGLGIQILSTGGTARAIRDAGVEVTDVAQVTGFPEILDGRVKTLHPAIHGGLLARRDDETHMQTIAEHGIETIDLVCVNLYPFEQTISRPGVTSYMCPQMPSQISVLPDARRWQPLIWGLKNVCSGSPVYSQTISLEAGSISRMADPTCTPCLSV